MYKITFCCCFTNKSFLVCVENKNKMTKYLISIIFIIVIILLYTHRIGNKYKNKANKQKQANVCIHKMSFFYIYTHKCLLSVSLSIISFFLPQ